MEKLRIIVVLWMVVLTGCTDSIQFDSLNIEPLLADIPEECNPTRRLGKCFVEINSPCDFDRNKYLNEMLEPDFSGQNSRTKNGTLRVPDIDTAVICVYTEDERKHVEMAISKGKITSLTIWDKSQLLSEAEGAFGKDKQNGEYYFLSGIQKIYNNSQIVLERKSNYKDGCHDFIESEKRYVADDNRQYYKFTKKEYVNYYDGYEAYYYGKTLNNINYRKIGDARFTIKGVRFEDIHGNQLPIEDILFIENPPYVLFETSVVKNGKRTYLAILNGENQSFLGDNGAFFNSNDPNSVAHWEHAVRCWFRGNNYENKYEDNYEECCDISALNDFEPRSPTAVYKASVDSVGNIMLKYDGDVNLPAVSMISYHAPYHSWFEEGLRKKIEKEQEIRLKRIRLEEKYKKEAAESKRWEICPECHGSGKMAQSGMGVVHGYVTCPCCGGRGGRIIHLPVLF